MTAPYPVSDHNPRHDADTPYHHQPAHAHTHSRRRSLSGSMGLLAESGKLAESDIIGVQIQSTTTGMNSETAAARSLNQSLSNRSRRSTVSSGISSFSASNSIRDRLGLGGVARRTLGIGLLLVVVLLWTISNFLASVSLCYELKGDVDADFAVHLL